MKKTASSFLISGKPVDSCFDGSSTKFKVAPGIPLDNIKYAADGWLPDCDIRQHYHRTLKIRRALLGKLI